MTQFHKIKQTNLHFESTLKVMYTINALALSKQG